MPKKSSRKKQSFEASLSELETLVDAMEEGDISLEESLKLFEQGVNLTHNCQQALKEAEQKLEILMQGSTKTEAFEDNG